MKARRGDGGTRGHGDSESFVIGHLRFENCHFDLLVPSRNHGADIGASKSQFSNVK